MTFSMRFAKSAHQKGKPSEIGEKSRRETTLLPKLAAWYSNFFWENSYYLCRGRCRAHCRTCDSGRWILQSEQLTILVTFCSLQNVTRITHSASCKMNNSPFIL